MVLAAELGLELELDGVENSSAAAILFSESTGRIVLTCADRHAAALERSLAEHGLIALGRVVEQPILAASLAGAPVLSLALAQLQARFWEGLHGL